MCDTIVEVGPDRVLFAKNSDRDVNEAQMLDWQPATDHPAGATVPCTHLEIPQAGHTHAVLLSRPFWMWGAEMGANEHGVTIGNEAVFTKQPYARTGLTGMDLLRLALERAETAQQAVEVITTLMGRHGQGGGCGHEKPDDTYHNSYLVADPHTAYVLETAGTLWEVEHVTRGARSISNGLTIPGFAAEHSDFLKTRFSGCRVRRALTEEGAGAAAGPGDLMAILRDHGGADPGYSILTGAMQAPCVHAGGFAAGSQSAASWVSELRAAGSRHWATATAAPCTGVFKPVDLSQPLDLGPAPTDRHDPATLWWRHEAFQRRALRDPAATFPSFRTERDDLERRWLAAPPDPADAFAAADAALARWDRSLPEVRDRRPWWVRRHMRIRDRRAGLPA